MPPTDRATSAPTNLSDPLSRDAYVAWLGERMMKAIGEEQSHPSRRHNARALAIAVTKIEEALMWADKGFKG